MRRRVQKRRQRSLFRHGDQIEQEHHLCSCVVARIKVRIESKRVRTIDCCDTVLGKGIPVMPNGFNDVGFLGDDLDSCVRRSALGPRILRHRWPHEPNGHPDDGANVLFVRFLAVETDNSL